MVRALFVCVLLALPSVASADGAFPLEITTRGAGADVTVVELSLVNQSSDTLVYETYDGGTLHNSLERLTSGVWASEGLGYCGLGHDGDVTLAPGARTTVRAYLTGTPGVLRVVMHASRVDANGVSTPVEIRSEPFTRR